MESAFKRKIVIRVSSIQTSPEVAEVFFYGVDIFHGIVQKEAGGQQFRAPLFPLFSGILSL